MLVDRRILAGGLAMLAAGIAISAAISYDTPAGRAGMTAEEAEELLEAQAEYRDYSTLAGILVGIGFLLVLISFGARRKRGAGAKKVQSKPEQQ